MIDAGSAFTRQDRECFADDGAFDAAAADAAGDFAGLGDGHRCARIARAGTLDVDHAGDRDAFAGSPPAVDVVEQIVHDSIVLPAVRTCTVRTCTVRTCAVGINAPR